MLVFILSCLVYNLALWGVVQLLNNAGVIGWELRWVEAGPITIGVEYRLLNVALWGVIQILHNAGAIGWDLRWAEAGPITIIVMLWRVWDRALFRRGEG